MKPLPPAPLTDEDRAIWFDVITDLLPALNMLGHISKLQDRRDAALLWEQSRIYPGAAVITVDIEETRLTHVIVGRVQRAVYEAIRRQWDLT